MQNRLFQFLSQKLSPKLNEKLNQKLSEVLNHPLRPALEERVSQGLRDFRELKELARHPRSLGHILDERSPLLGPWLGRKVLGAASNWTEPFTVGMGFNVQTVSEDAVEVTLPGTWRNQGEGGYVHSGALTALGEFAVRIFWEHHLDLRNSAIESRRVQVRLLAKPLGTMKAVFRLPVGDREAILQRLRAQHNLEIETQAHVYDGSGRLVAEIDADWLLSRRLTLGSREFSN